MDLIFIFVLVGFAGFVDAIAGGGGLITVPTYIAFGVPSDLILGTNKTVSTTGATIAVGRYIRANLIYWKLVIFAIVTALVGSAVGATLSRSLSTKWMLYILLVVTPLVLFLNYKYIKVTEKPRPSFSFRLAALSAVVGLVIGAYDGFFGPGTGSFLIVAFIWILGFSIKDASSNARIVNYSSNFSAFITFLLAGRISWPIVAVGASASIIGNYLGSHMVINRPEQVIKPVFNFVLVLLILKSAYEIFLTN